MKRVLVCLLLCCVLIVPVRAMELPKDFVRALPQQVEELWETGAEQNEKGVSLVWEKAKKAIVDALRENLHGAVRLVLVALLCGFAQGFGATLGSAGVRYIPAVGALAITSIAAGDLTTLVGAGTAAMEELGAFSQILLPTMATAIAAGGFTATAGLWQVATLFASEFLMRFTREVLLPAVYCYIGLAAAGALLPESRLEILAEGIKKLLTWLLCGTMTLFTIFLSVSNVLSGTADKTAVKMTKTVISGAVPVVGNILSEATEAVLSAASSLRSVIGMLGILAVLSLCLVPLLHLGIQFLLYKIAAFLASVAGVKALDRLIEQIGDAFGLVLGMTAACALVLMIAILVSITMVVM